MATSSQTQSSAAIALVQILTDYPELPVAGWYIDTTCPALIGHLHEGGMPALAAYADVLGGSIRAGSEYVSDGETLRSHKLSAKWRDVLVEVRVSLPVRSLAVAS
jgi:hypothetical protein